MFARGCICCYKPPPRTVVKAWNRGGQRTTESRLKVQVLRGSVPCHAALHDRFTPCTRRIWSPTRRSAMDEEWEAEFEQAFDDDDDDAQADGDGAEEHLLLEEPPDDFECDFGITEAASDLPHSGGGSSVPKRKRTRDGQHTAPAPAPPPAEAEEDDEEAGYMWGMNIMTGESSDRESRPSGRAVDPNAMVQLRYGSYGGLQLSSGAVRRIKIEERRATLAAKKLVRVFDLEPPQHPQDPVRT